MPNYDHWTICNVSRTKCSKCPSLCLVLACLQMPVMGSRDTCLISSSGVARLWSQGGHKGSRGPQRGPGAEPRWGMGRSPQKPWQFAAVKCFTTQVCCQVRPPSPLPPPKKTSDLREFHDPTWPGQGGHGQPTRGYATALESSRNTFFISRSCLSLETCMSCRGSV